MLKPTLAVIVTAVWGVLLLPGLLGAALSPMFFDAPGSMDNPAAWLNALIVVSFPVLCLLSIGGSWLVWSVRRRNPTRTSSYAAMAAAALPLIPITYFVVAMVIGTAGLLLSGQTPGLHSTIIKPLSH
ncbi:MAG TPA: hypothetical protein VIW73_00795 [Candidatus Cybelea sp.]